MNLSQLLKKSGSGSVSTPLLTALIAASSCFWSYGFAASSPTELLVRLRDAQNSQSQAALQLHGVLTPNAVDRAKVELINGSEGVVKLKFRNAMEAELAAARLSKSSQVLRVSKNHLYRPALKVHFRDVEQRPMLKPLNIPFLQLLAAATSIPDVQEPTAAVVPGVDPLAASDWSISNIKLPAFDSLPAAEKPVTTAVIDTGVDYNHEDLIGGMWRKDSNPLEVGYDFVHDNAKPYDLVHFDIEGCFKDVMCSVMGQTDQYLTNPGHGTHCAGHVGAVANNSLGIRGVGGSGNHVMALKFFYDYGEENAGAGDDAAAVKAIDYAVENGAKVISASWGGYQNRAEAEASELKQALIRARDAGVLFVVAAGNGDPMTGEPVDQDTVAEPSYPAAYDLDNIITVAAIDSNDQLAEFSNYGAKSVHIGAPGVKILSTISGGTYSDIVAKFTNPKSGAEQEIDWDGTSMATPIVAGAVALVWSQHPELSYQQVRELILSTARQIPSLTGKVSSGGTLDVEAALAAADRGVATIR